MTKIKICSKCEVEFSCTVDEANNECWCNVYPPLLPPNTTSSCLCKNCLHATIVKQINTYVQSVNTSSNNKAKELPRNYQLIEEIDYYLENGFYVFTAWHHLRRGYCCKNGCRHCPYGYKKHTI